MIGSLRGALLDRSPRGEVLIEVAGVGYRVLVAPSTLVELGGVGATVVLHTPRPGRCRSPGRPTWPS